MSVMAPQSWPMAAQHAISASVIGSPVAQFAVNTKTSVATTVHPTGRIQRAIHLRIAATIVGTAGATVNRIQRGDSSTNAVDEIAAAEVQFPAAATWSVLQKYATTPIPTVNW